MKPAPSAGGFADRRPAGRRQSGTSPIDFARMAMQRVCDARETGMPQDRGICFASPNGTELLGDFYQPAVNNAPIIIGVHGGGWQAGSRASYQNWGTWLAARGYALFAVDYRLSKPEKSYPEAVADVRAAIHYVSQNAESLDIDPGRIALIGDSAGAHLASLVALTDPLPGEPTTEPNPAGLKALVLFYGVYDLAAQWHHDQLARPLDQISQTFLGTPPMRNRKLFFEASPISHVEQDHRNLAFLIAYGTADNVVDHRTQSEAFIDALSESGKFVRKVVVTDAPHFFSVDPIDEPGSYSGVVAPRLLRFLKDKL
jgi:acetyl esterase/lipase